MYTTTVVNGDTYVVHVVREPDGMVKAQATEIPVIEAWGKDMADAVKAVADQIAGYGR